MNQLARYQLLPPLSDEEYQALKADIRVRGVLVALEYDELGNVLDGHHRERIIAELRAEGVKIDYPSNVRPGLSEHDKRAHVRALNMHRRHLTQAQRRELIAEQLRDTPEVSDRQIASKLGVSDKTVGAARRRLEGIAEIPQCSERQCADGRKYPSIMLKSEKEKQRALTTLDGMDTSVLPYHGINIRLLERYRRETDSAERARNVGNEPAVVGNADLRHGDFRDVLRDIPDESVDLICTDPPYGSQTLDLWSELGACAARILRPGGLLVAYSGQQHLPFVYAALTPHLHYVWQMAQIGKSLKTHNYNLNVHAMWKPIHVLAKPPFTRDEWFDDVIFGAGPEKDQHDWQQREDEARILIQYFSKKNDLVVDPMIGSGTIPAACVALGRRIIGCDIDGAAVSVSRERVRTTLERQDGLNTTTPAQ